MAELSPADQLTPTDLAAVIATLETSPLGEAFLAYAGQAGMDLSSGISFSTGITGLYSALFSLMSPTVATMPEQTIRGDNVATLLTGGALLSFADVPFTIDAWWRIDAAPGQTVTSVSSVLQPAEDYSIHLSDLPETLGTDHTVHGGRSLVSMGATGGTALGLRVQTDDSSDVTVHGFAVIQFCRS